MIPEKAYWLYGSTYENIFGEILPELLTVRYHEQEHVSQYEMLGPFFLPVYLALGGWWNNANPLEQGANAHARDIMKQLGTYYIENPDAPRP